MKSIMDKKDGTCYLCRLLYGDHTQKTVQEHHIFYGTSKRKLSEKYGLKVYLCLYHHTGDIRGTKEAVHRNKKMADLLHREGQEAFIRAYPNLNFLKIFGKSWLSVEEITEIMMEEKTEADGQMAAVSEGIIWHEPLDGEIPF